MQILSELMKRPIGDIAIVFGCVISTVMIVGTFVVLILRSIANLFGKLHIKKLGIGGIECDPEKPKSKLFRRRTVRK